MTELMKDAIMIGSGILGGCLVTIIRSKIVKQAKETVEEKFSGTKAVTGLLNVTSPVLWMKDIASIFNLRKLVIVGVIIGVVFGYGWYKGRTGAPVKIDLHGKEALIQLNEHFLQIDKDGTTKIVDKDGKVLKVIRVKDIDGLRQALRPYGFQLEPFVAVGGSMGSSGASIEAGVGLSWFKYFKWNLDSLLTNKGIYPLGVSYKLTDNSGLGLGAGMGWKGDQRVILYYKFRF
jgi:hypothetical protein